LRGWDEVQKEIIRVRKQQRILEEQRRQEEEQMRKDLFLLGAIVLVAFGLMAIVFMVAIIVH
jgi:hypothetical protein